MKKTNKDKASDDLYKMSKHELIDIIVNQDRELENHKIKYNKVSALDFSVESENESLSTCIQSLNELIKTNKDFSMLRKTKMNLDSSLGVG